MSLIQQQAKFWLKALIRIVDVINTQYSNETADLLKNGPFAAYGYLKDGDAGARKWSVVDRLMQGADAMGHAQEARNNIEDMYAAQPSVPYTDQPANHTATVQTPTTDNTPTITDEPITTTATSDASAEPIDITPDAAVIKEIQEEEENKKKGESDKEEEKEKSEDASSTTVNSEETTSAAKPTTLRTIDDIIANPKLLEGKTLIEVQNLLKHTSGWKEGTLKKGRSAGEGWTLSQLNSRRTDVTDLYIQYSPGSPRHFNGEPYWKFSSGKTGELRFKAGR